MRGSATVSVGDVFDTPKGQQYFEAETARRKRKERGSSFLLPAAAATLGAAGYATKRFGDAALTSGDRVKLDNFINFQATMGEQKGTPENWLKYTLAGSDAARAKVFGMSGPELILKVRTNPAFRAVAPEAWGINPQDTSKLQGSRDHYSDFATGPLRALLHQYDGIPHRLHDKDFKPDWAGLGVTQDGSNKAQVAEDLSAFAAVARSRMGDFVKDKHGVDLAGADKLPAQDQANTLREFNEYLRRVDPALLAKKNQVESAAASAQAEPSKIYANYAKLVTRGLQDLPRSLGTGAMVAGGAMGAWWLTNKALAYLDKKRKRRRVLVTVPAVKAASALGSLVSGPLKTSH